MSKARVGKTYRKYPTAVHAEIVRTQNIYLLPEQKIPRTTAQYWLKKQKAVREPRESELEVIYRAKCAHLEAELEKEKSLRQLLETVRKIFPYDFRSKHLKSKADRRKIIEAIREAKTNHPLAKCLNVIDLSKTVYQRWSAEMNFCEKRKTFCKRRHHTQLTEQELSTMKRYVMTKKYAHVSISSLHLLAQRKGKLFCSLDTWYKYVRIFEWKRPWQKSKKYRAYSGIKTKQINEIWHIDVTVVKVRPDIKLYIQAVIDNYSRYVLAWRVTKEINAENTVTTLKLAKQNAAKIVKQSVKPTVMMDPGTENANFRVLNFLSSKNLSRLLAQVDVRYSNSMIESLFRMFKNNYFYHQRIDGIDDLVRKAYFYFTQHNNFIPLAVHQGGRPCEIYTSTWNHDARNRLDKQKLDAKDERKKRNLSPACVSCPIPPHRGPTDQPKVS